MLTIVSSSITVLSHMIDIISAQWWIQRGIQGCTGTLLLATPSTKKYTDDR